MDILAEIKCGSKPLSNSILDVPGLDEDRRELSILGTGTTTYFPADFIASYKQVAVLSSLQLSYLFIEIKFSQSVFIFLSEAQDYHQYPIVSLSFTDHDKHLFP